MDALSVLPSSGASTLIRSYAHTFFAVGASHKSSTLNLREGLARIQGGDAAAALGSLRAGFNGRLSELCLLSTCNRYEIYAVGAADLGGDLKKYLAGNLAETLRPHCEEEVYILQGEEAVRHLFSVAGGLDSMVIGESEILGQVKTAYEQARQMEMTGSLLNTAFQRALSVGKRVRTETKISEGRLSVASVALELAGRIFANFSSVSVAVVGAGAMGTETAKGLLGAKPKSKVFLSRTLKSAQELAEQFGGGAATLEELPRVLTASDVILTQLSADHPVITREMVVQASPSRSRPLFILDIAMPRNVEEAVGGLANTYLYNIDDLKAIAQANYEKRRSEVESAKTIVEEEVLKFLPRLNGSKPSELAPEALASR